MLSNTLTSQHTWLHEVWLGAFRCHLHEAFISAIPPLLNSHTVPAQLHIALIL